MTFDGDCPAATRTRNRLGPLGLIASSRGWAGILALIVAAARCIFPLGLGGKLATKPMCVGNRILVRDVDDGMVLFTLDR
jgi:hypothetical protein